MLVHPLGESAARLLQLPRLRRANGVPSRLMSSRRGDNDMGSRRALRAHSTHGFASRLEPQAAPEMVCGLRRKCRCASIAPAKARRRNTFAIAFKPE